MSSSLCTAAIPVVTLTAYWLGELDETHESELEEHLFACFHCSERLRDLVRLGEAIRQATRAGRLHAVLNASFIRTLQKHGLNVREYRMHAGGSVACTIAPEDDLVVAHLHAPLQDVRRLDLLYQDVTGGTEARMQDVAFDPQSDEIVLVPNSVALRQLTNAIHRVQLVSVEESAERVLGTYTFNHSRYEPPV